MDLTREDIGVLFEALEAWEQKEASSFVTKSILGAVMGGNKSPDEFEAEMRQQSEEVEKKVRLRKERTIMLKAKLLQARDKAEASAFIAETLTAQA